MQHEDPAPTSDTKGTPAPEATTPTGQDPASAAPAVPDTIGLSLTPETSAPAPAGDLPRTGFPVCTLTVLALGLLLVGNALRLLSRRAATR